MWPNWLVFPAQPQLGRYQGYCDAMSAAGLQPASVLEMPSHTRSDLQTLLPASGGKQAMMALLCTNDLLAISVMGELLRAGYRVPQQISIIGFDGIDLGRLVYPSLTSVVQPLRNMGTQAITHLLALIAGKIADPILPLTMTTGRRRVKSSPGKLSFFSTRSLSSGKESVGRYACWRWTQPCRESLRVNFVPGG